MKNIILTVLALTATTPAFACMDLGYNPISTPRKFVKELAYNNRSFGQCIQKLADQSGINHPEKSASLIISRKDREENSTDSIIYTYKIMMINKDGKFGQMHIQYDLSKHAFECKLGYTTNLPKCM